MPLDQHLLSTIAEKVGTPAYVYSEASLLDNAARVRAFPHAFGLTVRYAMKAWPNAYVLRLFDQQGLHIDASSSFEVERALHAGIAAQKIQLTAQEIPAGKELSDLITAGVIVTACSLSQLDAIGTAAPGSDIALRVNPGVGSGEHTKTTVGGSASSFGIWHENLNDAIRRAEQNGLKVTRLHTHIGSGTDPAVWGHVAELSLAMVHRFPDVAVLNLGGGYKVGRMPDEPSTDYQRCGKPVREAFERFHQETGRRLHLDIEPGTALVANAGYLLSRVIDVKKTDHYTFLLVDSGMTEILRPTLYAAQHPITVIPQNGEDRRLASYVVVGHCCESGDLLTPSPDDPEVIQPRMLMEAKAGDFAVIGGAGAYCSAMCAANYNSFNQAAEVVVRSDDQLLLIRRRETLGQQLANECSEPLP